jgi:hypothetical protein
MTRRLIGAFCRRAGARLVCLGLMLTAVGRYLAPRKRPVVVPTSWSADNWTEAHEEPRPNAPPITGRN